MTIPEEVQLAVRFELGLATRAELSDFVDRRMLEIATPSDVLLALATPAELAPDDIARHLLVLAGLELDDAVPRMQIVIAEQLVTSGAITLDHAVAYLCVRVAAHVDGELKRRCGGLDDMLYLARNHTWGSEREVHDELRALAGLAAS